MARLKNQRKNSVAGTWRGKEIAVEEEAAVKGQDQSTWSEP